MQGSNENKGTRDEILDGVLDQLEDGAEVSEKKSSGSVDDVDTIAPPSDIDVIAPPLSDDDSTDSSLPDDDVFAPPLSDDDVVEVDADLSVADDEKSNVEEEVKSRLDGDDYGLDLEDPFGDDVVDSGNDSSSDVDEKVFEGESTSDPLDDMLDDKETSDSDPLDDMLGDGEASVPEPNDNDFGDKETSDSDPLDDMLGDNETPASDPLDDMLGGGEDESEEPDPIDDMLGDNEAPASDPLDDMLGGGEDESEEPDPLDDMLGDDEAPASDPLDDMLGGEDENEEPDPLDDMLGGDNEDSDSDSDLEDEDPLGSLVEDSEDISDWQTGLSDDEDDDVEDFLGHNLSEEDDIASTAFGGDESENENDSPVDGVRNLDDVSSLLDQFAEESDSNMDAGGAAGDSDDELNNPMADIPPMEEETESKTESKPDMVEEAKMSKEGAVVDTEDHVESGQKEKKGKAALKFVLGGLLVVASVAAGIGVSQTGALSKYIPLSTSASVDNNDKIAQLESMVLSLNSKVKNLTDKPSQSAETEKLAVLYQELVEANKALFEEQEKFKELTAGLKSELATYETAMIGRLESVIKVATQVSVQQANQEQEIKDSVLREALAVMEKQRGEFGGERLSSVIKKMEESQRRSSQLESKILAMQDLFSLMEDEVGYLKTQVRNGSTPSATNTEVRQPEKPLVMKAEKPSFVEENTTSRDVKVFVDPRAPATSSSEPVKPEYYLAGVFSKGRGGYEIYIQDANAPQGMSQAKPYVFTPNQSSTIPGYGKIVSVMKLSSSTLRVPYIVETENGTIMGKR